MDVMGSDPTMGCNGVWG